jgi:hypothetical protein
MTSLVDREFGILTCATPNDYLKAIGLALSVRVSNPGVPIAVACSERVRPLVEPFFDVVTIEEKGIRGFVHKVYLDKYTPFRDTMFFDSDVLVFKPVAPYLELWGDYPYRAVGDYRQGGISSFGLDRVSALKRLGKDSFVVIDGAGHALFRKPGCIEVFERARFVTSKHKEYFGDIQYADEDVMDYVMTELDLPPAPTGEFFSRYLSARPDTLQLDASRGVCSFIRVDNGEPISPCMMHFAANEAPFPYHRQLRLLFRKFGVDESGLRRSAFNDFYDTRIHSTLHRIKFNTMKRLGLK